MTPLSQKIAGPEIERLIQLLARLPGLGPRSARKAALALLKKRQELLIPLAEAIRTAADKIVECENCGNVDTLSPCTICRDPRRDRSLAARGLIEGSTAHNRIPPVWPYRLINSCAPGGIAAARESVNDA